VPKRELLPSRAYDLQYVLAEQRARKIFFGILPPLCGCGAANSWETGTLKAGSPGVVAQETEVGGSPRFAGRTVQG
jgi:hypothetical protein